MATTMAATLGALWGISHLVDRETKQRHEAFSVVRNRVARESMNKPAGNTIVNGMPLAAERPVASRERDELMAVPKTKENPPLQLIESRRKSDEATYKGDDPVQVMPHGESNYYRTKQKQFYLPNQERENLRVTTIGNVKQTSPYLSNKALLGRNAQPSVGPLGIGSATGVNPAGKAWQIENIDRERNKVKQTGYFMPIKRKNDGGSYEMRLPFAKPQYHFAPNLARAPTFLQPHKFDVQDCKVNRPTLSTWDMRPGMHATRSEGCQPKHDRTYTETGVMYKSLPCKMMKGFHGPVNLMTDEKEDHVFSARNPGITKTPEVPQLHAPKVFTHWRRKLESLSQKGMSVPHVPHGLYPQPNAASKLFSVYRKKRDDFRTRPIIGNSTLSNATQYPKMLDTPHRSVRKQESFAVANPRYNAPANISDLWKKPHSKGVADVSSNYCEQPPETKPCRTMEFASTFAKSKPSTLLVR